MFTKFDERPNAARFTQDPAWYDTVWVMEGVDSDLLVQSLAQAFSAQFVNTANGVLWRQDVECRRIGYKLYDVFLSYGPKRKGVMDVRLSGSTTGGTLRIKACEHIADFPDDPSTPNHEGAINVNGDDVEGTDIVVPALNLVYTVTYPKGYVSEAWAIQMARYTGRVNENAWRGFQPGEALYMGCDFQNSATDVSCEVVHYVAGAENLIEETIASIPNVTKNGWDIAWIECKPDVHSDSGKAIKGPRYVHVERPYKRSDFASFLGF